MNLSCEVFGLSEPSFLHNQKIFIAHLCYKHLFIFIFKRERERLYNLHCHEYSGTYIITIWQTWIQKHEQQYGGERTLLYREVTQ